MTRQCTVLCKILNLKLIWIWGQVWNSWKIFLVPRYFLWDLMDCIIWSRSTNHDLLDWTVNKVEKGINNFHGTPVTRANGNNYLKDVVVWKLNPSRSMQLHVCAMFLLFSRTCLERNSSSLRIFCWSGLLPMFALTEYLMTFVATYSFFYAVLMRETWIWCVLVTFNS